jgi:hypothetical protein
MTLPPLADEKMVDGSNEEVRLELEEKNHGKIGGKEEGRETVERGILPWFQNVAMLFKPP